MFNIKTGNSFLIGFVGVSIGSVAHSQVVDKGISPASNTYRSYQDASINRDSGLYQPLDLLNDFYPSIEIRIEDHDNVRRRSDFDEEDLLIVASPSLGYRTNIGRHQFYAAYNGTFTFHDEIEQEDAEEHTVSAKLGLDLTRRWDLELFGALGDSFERRGISGGRQFSDFINGGLDTGPEEITFRSYGADLIFGRKIGIIQAVLGYDYLETGFKSDDLDPLLNFSDGRDRTQESVHFDLNWQFSDRTSLFGRVQKTDVDYDRSDSPLDSDQTDYLVGLRWKPANALSGAVGVGFSEKEFDDRSREKFDGSIYYANLNYAINPLSVVSLNASRTVEEPGDLDSDYYESEYFGVAWSHSLTPRSVLDIYAKSIDDDYSTFREDKFFDWGAELSYTWRSWMTASVYYGEIDRDSNLDNVAYDDSYFGIRLRSDLRSLLRSYRDSDRAIEPSSFGPEQKTKRLRSE